jgi:hypothetical protein
MTAATKTALAGVGKRVTFHVVDDSGQSADRAPPLLYPAILARLAALEAQMAELTARVTGNDTLSHDNIITSRLDILTAACAEQAITVSADGYILESAAARLLGRSKTTLRNWRYEARPLPFRLLGGRIEYRLADLASFLEGRSED